MINKEQKQPTKTAANDCPEYVKKAIRSAQAAYAREWRQKNPEKFLAIQQRFWLKKAAQIQSQANTTEVVDKED